MTTDHTPKKTLKQEELWLIDNKQGEITYDVSDDVTQGWWETLGTDYGATVRQPEGQSGEFARISKTTGIQWFDHHSQAYNDSGRRHPQRHEVDKTDDGVKIKS